MADCSAPEKQSRRCAAHTGSSGLGVARLDAFRKCSSRTQFKAELSFISCSSMPAAAPTAGSWMGPEVGLITCVLLSV
jgi:hypothetical protein